MRPIWQSVRSLGIVCFCLLNIMPIHPVHPVHSVYSEAQECIEIWNFWSDQTRHEVNLETGEVISYDGEFANQSRVFYTFSPDRRYNHDFDAANDTLTLTDNRTGITTTLSEQAYGQVYWSDDSQWLAYRETDETSSEILTLTLYHVETTEFLSIEISTSEEATIADVAWSSDANRIAVSYAPNPFVPMQLLIYSVPQLEVLQQIEASWYLSTLVWSPSGRYVGITGMSQEVGIIDTVTQEFHTVTLDGFSSFHPQWSPYDTYLVVHFIQNDFHDNYNFIDPQGNVILKDFPVVRPVDWVNEHTVLAQLATETGFDDLVLHNLQEGEQRLILSKLYHYALSSDARYLATRDFNSSNSSDAIPPILFFDLDLSQPDSIPDFRLTLDMAYNNFIWRTDALELLVFFEDRSLQSYNFETGEWQMIASIPGEEWGMQHVPCHSHIDEEAP